MFFANFLLLQERKKKTNKPNRIKKNHSYNHNKKKKINI